MMLTKFILIGINFKSMVNYKFNLSFISHMAMRLSIIIAVYELLGCNNIIK